MRQYFAALQYRYTEWSVVVIQCWVGWNCVSHGKYCSGGRQEAAQKEDLLNMTTVATTDSTGLYSTHSPHMAHFDFPRIKSKM
jgi:hypothetical protein